ncbi:hypothetical protein AGLY_007240 [Aphis glycines]|uniref:Uncharacterized protein n=1 Tax=Aphis glycines TaxID=307491 RepID=A0A6G0TPK3_APHGL|nr:hypothetical protein AGLY_007240 [Aphis glycines]
MFLSAKQRLEIQVSVDNKKFKWLALHANKKRKFRDVKYRDTKEINLTIIVWVHHDRCLLVAVKIKNFVLVAVITQKCYILVAVTPQKGNILIAKNIFYCVTAINKCNTAHAIDVTFMVYTDITFASRVLSRVLVDVDTKDYSATCVGYDLIRHKYMRRVSQHVQSESTSRYRSAILSYMQIYLRRVYICVQTSIQFVLNIKIKWMDKDNIEIY